MENMINEQLVLSLKNPILANHSAYGQELLPGLAYPDLIFQVFRKHHYSYSQLELRNLVIHHPLIVGQDYNILLSIRCIESKVGQWQVRVEGREQSADIPAPSAPVTLTGDKKYYAAAEMHCLDPVVFAETLEFSAVKASTKKIVDLNQVYEGCRRRELVHTGFIKAEGKIYDGDTALFMDISLGEAALPSADAFMFHPALMDGSAIGAGVKLSSLVKEEQRLFLPLFCQSFCAAELLQKQCITRVQTSSLRRKGELLYLTMEFFNQSGKKVGELKNFTMKLVRGAGSINPLREKTPLPAAVVPELRSSLIPQPTSSPGPKTADTGAFMTAESFLRQLMADRLKKPPEQIETRVGYYEMGLDSPGLLDTVQAIEAKVGVPLPPTLLFEYTTIKELAAYLTQNYPSQFNQSDQMPLEPDPIKSFCGVQGRFFQKEPLAAGGKKEEPIAIIGMAGRYPGARNLREFWKNLQEGKDSITEIPDSRWDWHRLEGLQSPSGKSMSRWGGFLEEPDCFDPRFFRISPREAEMLDPQERLFLETCWEAIEDAGYTPETLVPTRGPNRRRLVGVFAGVMHKDYSLVGAEVMSAAPGQVFPLSLNDAAIANRVSYFCNFHGPSMAIDTVCSSSLTALHLALESIRSGESEAALAGGVNLSLHPHKYITYGMADMHSSDGYCHTFGKGGDGYVSGEGVGAVLLKPLAQAIQDRDHIYAVIKGSTINHGGTASGMLVPSPVAQADMIVSCLEKTGIHPRTISCVEAHGTGTSLGDPIEIEGLVKAYSKYTTDMQFCSIGSVKSNIGHAESAAGIAGLSKAVLQLYYKTLVPSLHAEESNPYIDFKQSPFYLQHKTEEWKTPVIKEKDREAVYPRRVGLSSFGATGSNAHVILEEYLPGEMQPQAPAISHLQTGPVIIPLSARNKDRLHVYAASLLEFLGRPSSDINPVLYREHQEEKKITSPKESGEPGLGPSRPEINLASLAYTLQVGRKALEERVAFLVRGIPDLVEKLEAFIQNRDDIHDCFRGQVKANKETLALFTADEDSREILDKWLSRGKLNKLAELWSKGLDIDWDLLYKNGKPWRLSLPTYPFARERYWLPVLPVVPGAAGIASGSVRRAAVSAGAASLHPLVQENTADFSEQRFSSIFTGQEFFLADHVVKGQRVLPGVAYLEMVRAAVERAAGGSTESWPGMRLINVVWLQPLVVGNEPVQVHIGLLPRDNGQVAFEIYSQSGAGSGERLIYSQGSAVLRGGENQSTLDLAALQAQCSQSILSASQCYEAFKSVGIDYGPGHRGVEAIYAGTGQVLAKLSLPSSLSGTRDRFVLHPALLDSALQASVGLFMGSGQTIPAGKTLPLHPVLPFALQELEILGKCTPSVWALARFAAGSSAGDKVQKIDIDVCDPQGIICVRMKGLSSRVLEGEVGLGSTAAPEVTGTLMLHPYWREQVVTQETAAPGYAQRLVILCEPGEKWKPGSWEAGKLGSEEEKRTRGVTAHIIKMIRLQSQQGDIGERYQAYAARIFEEIQGIFKNKPEGKVLIQVVVPGQGEQQLFSGLSGMLKTASLENPKFIGQLIEVEPGEEPQRIIEKLEEDSRSPHESRIRYQADKRRTAGWKEVDTSPENEAVPWKDRGVYLITGGAGGLGLIFAREIARQTRNATLILIGRSPLDQHRKVRLKEIEGLGHGTRVEYRPADVSRKEAAAGLLQDIRQDFGSLHGIIHSAGVIRDNIILKKSEQELQEVLAPKVAAVVNLDRASQDLPLDFFIFFSSGAGALGNIGQADYAAANAFMDAYAGYRNRLVALKQRQGQTLSIGWPLWKEGGMRVDEEKEKMWRHSLGMVAMPTAAGIRALYRCLTSKKDQVLVLEGKLAKMKQKLLAVATPPAPPFQKGSPVPGTAAGIDTDSLADKIKAALKHTAAGILKVKSEDIDVDTDLSEYGFDSISFTQLANQLNQEFKLELNPTAFFQHPTLNGFARYLAEEYHAVLAVQWAVPAEIDPPGPAGVNDAPEYPSTRRYRWSGTGTSVLPAPGPGTFAGPTREPIAIIGMSGRFPMAGDLQEFWQNLVGGKDCITEIPGDRWDWREYWGDPAKEANKTNIKWGGFIEGVDRFDPLFFGISPREAVLMDPQQRLLMTYVWKTIDDAGYSAQSLWGTQTAIFVGTAVSGYGSLISRANVPIEGYTSTGISPSVGPNRMSYFLNLHGPSEPIDTACSSSLLAIHRAVEALHNGACEMAIVGGVNTIVTPEAHISFNKAGMLSEDGRCKTFSDQANGYGRGEGVGMLFLKTLAAAEAAGDHIYGLIRATAVNHGGRANSLTAPNPNAQAELLKTAYTRAAIDPTTITYIETHGTGTALGDPIEINGLKKAFRELCQAAGETRPTSAYCGLASVKSNIGHLELAAGIAGVIKVLLQLKHKTLVKSLHCPTINPYIQLENSPFYILRETVAWKALQDSQGKDLLRRAGVSSFGFGGVNAHVVMEEYSPGVSGSVNQVADRGQAQGTPHLIILSAKNETQLREQAQQLLAFLEEEQFPEAGLADMAYTLQVGRDAMEERLAMMVESVKTLKEKLQDFLKGREEIAGLYRGQVKRHNDTLALFTADEELQEAIEKWVQRRKWAKLPALWVKGLNFDWNRLYDGNKPGKPQRISLPTYPFAGERYWISGLESEAGSPGPSLSASAPAAVLHPLLQQNTSDLVRQRFSSTFTGREFFLADHVVRGRHVLPGVAYLEMARAAVVQAAGPWQEGRTAIRLKNVAWIRPIAVGEQPVQVHIELTPGDNGEIGYEIYTRPEAVDAGPVLHSQGTAVLVPEEAEEAASLDLESLQAGCSRGAVSSTRFYEAFRAVGLDYGPGHQGIETVYLGADQVLARLSLPASVPAARPPFVLHPSLMDSALQASLGLIMDPGEAVMPGSTVPPVPLTHRPALPFALQELEIFSHCTPTMWALVRYTEGSSAGDRVQKLDIDLSDETGKICVRLKGFSLRTPEGETVSSCEILMLQPCWNQQPIPPEAAVPTYAQHLVILCEPEKRWKQGNWEVGKRGKGQMAHPFKMIDLQSSQEEIEQRFQKYTLRVFEEIQGIIKNKPREKVLIQVVVSTQDEQLLFSGLTGLLKTARLENPNLLGQLIEVEPGEEPQQVMEQLEENSRSPLDTRIRYQKGKRWVAGWKEIEVSPTEVVLPWKDRGVYLITGGAGGLGLIFAREIARQAREAVLVLVGRSPLHRDKQEKLDELQGLGARIEYRQVDVTQPQAAADLLRDILDKFGNLHGILHCAGVIRDNFILKKTGQELQEVLAPKVCGLVNLDRASKDLNLDFLVLFSSLTGGLGNPGQADYAAANAFMDAYARYRNLLAAAKQRQGKTLSIDWPLWQEGGMQVDEETRKIMRQSLGMIPMPTSSGIRAFYQAFASGQDQVMVLAGERERFRSALLTPKPGLEPAKTTAAPGTREALREKAVHSFKNLLASEIKLPATRIEADAPLEKYGIDSLMVIRLTDQLEKIFGSLPKTLFFEYQNLRELAGYFLETYPGPLAEWVGLEIPGSPAGGTTPVKSTPGSRPGSRFASPHLEPGPGKAVGTRDIAVVGLAGRYPQANNTREFWENLRAGKDCITEIPKDRWDNNLYYDKHKNRPGKIYSRWGGFLEGVDRFDPLFFNISPREAELMDPQVRLFLETVWQLLESAGYSRETLQRLYQGRVGVYVGAMYQQYQLFAADLVKESATALSSYSSIANRVSYFFNFQGPSTAIDTMCSSALVSIHLACESLLRGDCQLAIAGGVNLSLHPKKYVGLSQAQMIGSHPNSRSFADGDGYLPAEGVGAVLLKSLSQAIRDRDTILAVIKSTTTNHGGHTNGFSVPNPNAQAQLCEDNFIKSGIDPRTISYVEAAANGSALGDPIEIAALTRAFGKFTRDRQFCAIGSVKSNIGHAEAASGISQLTKVILQLQHQQLVPSIKAEPLNPNLNLTDTPFYLQRELSEWKRPVVKIAGEEREFPRRATVSSFGAGGSNAHLIAEEYLPPQKETLPIAPVPRPQIVVFSAQNPDRLQAVVRQILEFTEQQKELSLADLAYTLQVGREAMTFRAALVANNREELIRGLKTYLDPAPEDKDIETPIPIFTGNLEADHQGIRDLLGGKAGEALLQILQAENNLEKIALHWSQGGKVPWESLHEGEGVRRVSLPTYPFAKRRCWLESPPGSGSGGEPLRSWTDTANPAGTTPASLEHRVIAITSGLLGMTPGEVNTDKPLEQYGFDSIILMQLFQQLQAQVDPTVPLDALQECRTIKDVIKVLSRPKGDQPVLGVLDGQTARVPGSAAWSQFPELIHLNRTSPGSSPGPPVFWFHGGLGGVEAYQAIARKCQRPFCGIQARGWMTQRSPLHGIEAMAAYYIYIIRSVQPEGPYDLGGYSLGGVLAYEVARQLQELGQAAASIVMLDSLDSTHLNKINKLQKTEMLQAVNTALISTVRPEPGRIPPLIHRDEVNAELEDEAFLQQIIRLAKARGSAKTETQLQTLVHQSAKVQQAYEVNRFSALPLPDPQSVTCYYFRNKSRLFLGELAPYLTLTVDEIPLDHTDYGKEWEQHLPNLHIMDVESSNHFMLLSEPKAFETIAAFCERLYSPKGVSAQFIKSLTGKCRKTQNLKDVSTMRKKTAKKAAGTKK
jgi:polyketide synthase PksN